MSDSDNKSTGSSPLVRQHHGGAILVGNLGNRGGGRRASQARQAARREAQLQVHLNRLPAMKSLEDAQAWLCEVAGLVSRGLMPEKRAAIIIRAVEAWVRIEQNRIDDLEPGLEQRVGELERQRDPTHQERRRQDVA